MKLNTLELQRPLTVLIPSILNYNIEYLPKLHNLHYMYTDKFDDVTLIYSYGTHEHVSLELECSYNALKDLIKFIIDGENIEKV